MSRISKKQAKVKRSRAAKKGWATRRKRQRKAILQQKEATYRERMKELDKMLADAEKTTSYKIVAHKAAIGAITLADALQEIPEADHEAVVKHVIQARMKRAERLYGDVRVEAWEIAEELDWDISEVYDAWDYEEGSAA